jgi:hypothetical protein
MSLIEYYLVSQDRRSKDDLDVQDQAPADSRDRDRDRKSQGHAGDGQAAAGLVPNMYGAMANEPALFESYATSYALFRAECGFTPAEQGRLSF